MTTANDRLPRLLALVPWLRAHPGVRQAEAAAAFGITKRQLTDDLMLLWVCGLPAGGPGDLMDFDFSGDTVTVIDPQTLDRPLRLTRDEALTLLVGLRALADVPGLAEREAVDRALEVLSAAIGPAPAAVTVALEPQDEVLGSVRAALDRGRRLRLRYLVEARDEVTERDVDPLRLHLRGGRWYLEGWCHRVAATRLFRLDRMLSVGVLDAPAEPPPDAEPLDLADGLFRPSPGDERVVLELAPTARWVVDQYPCESVEELPDGGVRVALRTPHTDWVRRLVLRLGGAAVVTAPEGLRADVISAAETALREAGG